MREILFKAKRLSDGEWVEGSHILIDDVHYIVPSGKRLKDIGEVDPSTVCEWTGLIDKNGTKVFEDDRILDPHENIIFVVEYDPLEAGFTLREMKLDGM